MPTFDGAKLPTTARLSDYLDKPNDAVRLTGLRLGQTVEIDVGLDGGYTQPAHPPQFGWVSPVTGLGGVVRGRIIRTGAATQKAYVTLTTSAPIGVGSLAGGAGINVAAAEDLTGTVVLAITAEATADNDLICDGMIAGKTPA